MIRAVHHVSITTPDVSRMLGFYSDLLDLPLAIDTRIAANLAFDAVVGLRDCQARSVMLQAGNTFIEFWQFAQPRGRPPIDNRPVCDAGLTHLCFDIDDAHREYERLVAAGVRFESPPQDLGSVVVCYARDPDGNIVELRQQKSGYGGGPVSIPPDLLGLSLSRLGRPFTPRDI